MGFEVIFKCKDKKDDGSYDVDNIRTFKKTVGKATDDTPLETLAKLIFGQLARRDVWVVDAEIYEYTKKKISFKENKDGILIKNKKFSFDLTCENIEINSTEDTEQQEDVHEIDIKPKQKTILPPAIKQSPIRWEIYDPHPDIAVVARKKNVNFTIGKKYPIYEEKLAGNNVLMGMNYITEDDNGSRRMLNDKHFTPIVNMLENGFESDDRSAEERAKLSHQNTFNDNQPAIYTLRR